MIYVYICPFIVYVIIAYYRSYYLASIANVIKRSSKKEEFESCNTDL